MAGSIVVRVPLKSPDRTLTNSFCTGEDSGNVGGLGVVLELAAAFVDSAMIKLSRRVRDGYSTVTCHLVTFRFGQNFLYLPSSCTLKLEAFRNYGCF